MVIIIALVFALLTPTHAPACTTEDAVGPCYWDASIHGNGQGDSFYVDAQGHVHYVRTIGADHD